MIIAVENVNNKKMRTFGEQLITHQPTESYFTTNALLTNDTTVF